jgi:hypothetical protein
MTQKTGNYNPVSAATGTLMPLPPSLSGMPDEIICEIILFNPESVRALREVSRIFRENTEDFLQWNAEKIFLWCSSTHSPLANLIGREFASIPQEAQPGRISILFYSSLSRAIISLGVPQAECPGIILLAQEIPQFNSRVRDVNLERVWPHIHLQILWTDQRAEVPAKDATAREIRAWMRAEANQPLLQSITQVFPRRCELTSLPEEIGLCTGLQRLYLDHNRLTFLPEEVFRELTALQSLTLSCNELTLLPERIFRGLTALEYLDLSYNQLDSLPEEIFLGLGTLRQLSFEYNRFTALPVRIFHGLTALEGLFFQNNQITSFLEGTFLGLNALRVLSISNNQLTALPEGISRELGALEKIYLYGNPQLLVSYEDPPMDMNSRAFRTMVDGFFNYRCRSPFAELYQLAAKNAPLEVVQASFSRLPVAIKTVLDERVRKEAGRPASDSEWDEQRTFEDMSRFQRVLKKYVRDSFEASRQKAEVYQHVFDLAEEQGVYLDSDVSNWKEVHVFGNIPRLIDAMMRQQDTG